MLLNRKYFMESAGVRYLRTRLLCLDKQIGISERGQTYLPFYVWNECTRSLKLKF